MRYFSLLISIRRCVAVVVIVGLPIFENIAVADIGKSRVTFDISIKPGTVQIISPGSGKFTEVQLYMSSSCQPGSRVINNKAFSDIEKPSLISDLAVKSENKKAFSTSKKARIISLGPVVRN